MGAFRSVHEAINNSCLRIVDGEYRAVHRTTMSTSVMEDLRYGPRKANDGSLRLAIIQTVDDDTGLPLSVRVCSDVIWVSADLFSKLPVTGQRVELDPEAFRTQVWIPGRESPTDAGRKLYSGTGPVTEVDSGSRGWVVLVTDTSARRKGKGDDTWFACGLEAPKEAPECTVGADVRACFARAIEGTRDGQAGGPFEGALVPVSSPDDEGTVIGYRLSARGAPPAGTPVWVKVDETESQIVEIRLAVAWRRVSSTRLSERFRGWEPCAGLAAEGQSEHLPLCPTCRIFGSAADAPVRNRPSRQLSYRGHVRIDDAIALGVRAEDGKLTRGAVDLSEVSWRPPLGSPRPTAGQFYLENMDVAVPTDLSSPLAYWDSEADRKTRRIRGRKFYWRTLPAVPSSQRGRLHRSEMRGDPPPRFTPTATVPTPPPTLIKQVRLVAPGAVFKTRVSFENLTPAELGSLISCLAPQYFFSENKADAVTSVGGGRPFGWGTVRTAITHLHVASAEARYTNRPTELPPTVKEAVSDFLAVMSEKSWWPDTRAELQRTLRLGAVADLDVWYPAPRGTERGSEEYDHAYAYFGMTNGTWVKTRAGLKNSVPLVNLPHPTDNDQHLSESAP